MLGILAFEGGFELICGGSAVGARRHLDAAAVSALDGFSRRYYELLQSSNPAAGFWRWAVSFMSGSMAMGGS
jgi:hypothetical protein